MNRRLAKARRILAAQTGLDRLAAWKLIDLAHQAAEVDARRVGLVGFLDAEPGFGSPFAGAMMRKLESLEASRAALRLEQAAQAERRLAERTRMRCAADIVKMLERDERRRDERLQLSEAIDASLVGSTQGSGKLNRSS